MMDLNITFEDAPWETLLSTADRGSSVSAVSLLAMLEGEDEERLEDAFQTMEERGVLLEITGLPKYRGEGQTAQRLRREEQLAQSALRPEALEEGDPLRIYLEELSIIPAFGDEEILARECAAGDEDAKVKLTNLGLSRVVELARNYVGYGVLLQDLIQEGSLGLWLAVDSFRTGDYAAFRDRKIRDAMARAVARQAWSGGIGEKLRKRMADFQAADSRLLTELGRNPTLEEISAEMRITMEEAEAVGKMLQDAKLLQDQTKPRQEEENRPVEDTAYFQMRQRITELLSVLPQEDAELLTMRFGLDRELPLSPQETAAKLGIPVESVIAREAAALGKLRQED